MRQFVCQNQLKLCVSNRQIFRQKDGRTKNAEGKRRTAAVAHADARIARKAEAVKPVSYTHLDVYKRQIQSRAGLYLMEQKDSFS